MNTKNPRKTYITTRDERILESLAAYRYLTDAQLARLHFPTLGAAAERLRRLVNERVLRRMYLPIRAGERPSRRVFVLTRKGALLLAHRRGEPVVRHPVGSKSPHLAHDLARNDVRLVLELLNAQGALRLASWKHAKADVTVQVKVPGQRRAVRLVPDGVFRLVTDDLKEVVYILEIDRGTVGHRRMQRRYAAYWHALRSGALMSLNGGATTRILTLTVPSKPRRGRTRLERLRESAMSAPANGRRGSGLFWFSTLDRVDLARPEGLLKRIWHPASVTDDEPKSLIH